MKGAQKGENKREGELIYLIPERSSLKREIL